MERRLDAVVYRAKLSTTIFSARQLINHGHVRVNGKKVNISSYQLKEEETIEIRDKSKQLAFIDIALANKERELHREDAMEGQLGLPWKAEGGRGLLPSKG